LIVRYVKRGEPTGSSWRFGYQAGIAYSAYATADSQLYKEMDMKWAQMIAGSGLGFAMACAPAYAQDVDGELTIRVVPNVADLPEVIRQTLALPDSASDEGVENSAAGLAIANENRAAGLSTAEQNRAEAAARREEAMLNAEAGLNVAAEARARAAERSEAAQENRADAARGQPDLDLAIPAHLPELPSDARAELPTLPDLSDLPGRPTTPGPNN
jgi:hypothetical protein